jgi:hypothetical protein
MALSNQGFGSGLTQGFEMMDNFYMNEAKKKSYLDESARADRSMELKELQETRLQDAADESQKATDRGLMEKAAKQSIYNLQSALENGQVLDQEDLDNLSSTGFDLMDMADPAWMEALNYFKSGMNDKSLIIGSADFNRHFNVMFKSELQKGAGSIVDTYSLEDSRPPQLANPQSMPTKANKRQTNITGQIISKRALQTYVLPQGGIGADIEVTYRKEDGTTGTYIAPMTKHRQTAGEGDNEVGVRLSDVINKGYGKVALATAYAPYLERIKAHRTQQGLDPVVAPQIVTQANIIVKEGDNFAAFAKQALGDAYQQLKELGVDMGAFGGLDSVGLTSLMNERGIRYDQGAMAAYLQNLKASEEKYAEARRMLTVNSPKPAEASPLDMYSQGWGVPDQKDPLMKVIETNQTKAKIASTNNTVVGGIPKEETTTETDADQSFNATTMGANVANILNGNGGLTPQQIAAQQALTRSAQQNANALTGRPKLRANKNISQGQLSTTLSQNQTSAQTLVGKFLNNPKAQDDLKASLANDPAQVKVLEDLYQFAQSNPNSFSAQQIKLIGYLTTLAP